MTVQTEIDPVKHADLIDFLQREKVETLLDRWQHGDEHAFDELFGILFEDFTQIAHFQMRGERCGHTLQTGDLVSKLYLKMRDAKSKPWKERTHFKRSASRMMKQILIDHARGWIRRSDGKAKIPLQSINDEADFKGTDGDLLRLLAIKQAIEKLEALDPKMATIAYLKIVHGYTIDQISKHIDSAPTNVKREWKLIRKIIGPKLLA